MSASSRNIFAILGLLIASFLVSLGTFWAFQKGGDDFTVFYVAWKHVLSGEPMQIYHVSPDRFLYAPGFAWIFAPLALLPKNISLALWCFAKAGVLGWIVREFALPRTQHDPSPYYNAGITAWGVLLLANPILIDFQYGQVNLLIVAACSWALLRHTDPESHPVSDFLSWFVLGIAAIGKLFPIPLLLIPIFANRFKNHQLPRKKLAVEICGMLLGIFLSVATPIFSVGLSGWLELMREWKDALVDRGFPLESHNQSFGAFLTHYASGLPTQIIAQHRREMSLGWNLFSPDTISFLASAWSFAIAALILGFILARPRWTDLSNFMERSRWVAVLVALLILPSHLVWKPYFVMGIPAALLLVYSAVSRRRHWLWFVMIFVLTNLTSFDIVGKEWSARFEAASTLLWCYLAILFLGRGVRLGSVHPIRRNNI